MINANSIHNNEDHYVVMDKSSYGPEYTQQIYVTDATYEIEADEVKEDAVYMSATPTFIEDHQQYAVQVLPAYQVPIAPYAISYSHHGVSAPETYNAVPISNHHHISCNHIEIEDPNNNGNLISNYCHISRSHIPIEQVTCSSNNNNSVPVGDYHQNHNGILIEEPNNSLNFTNMSGNNNSNDGDNSKKSNTDISDNDNRNDITQKHNDIQNDNPNTVTICCHCKKKNPYVETAFNKLESKIKKLKTLVKMLGGNKELEEFERNENRNSVVINSTLSANAVPFELDFSKMCNNRMPDNSNTGASDCVKEGLILDHASPNSLQVLDTSSVDHFKPVITFETCEFTIDNCNIGIHNSDTCKVNIDTCDHASIIEPVYPAYSDTVITDDQYNANIVDHHGMTNTVNEGSANCIPEYVSDVNEYQVTNLPFKYDHINTFVSNHDKNVPFMNPDNTAETCSLDIQYVPATTVSDSFTIETVDQCDINRYQDDTDCVTECDTSDYNNYCSTNPKLLNHDSTDQFVPNRMINIEENTYVNANITAKPYHCDNNLDVESIVPVTTKSISNINNKKQPAFKNNFPEMRKSQNENNSRQFQVLSNENFPTLKPVYSEDRLNEDKQKQRKKKKKKKPRKDQTVLHSDQRNENLLPDDAHINSDLESQDSQRINNICVYNCELFCNDPFKYGASYNKIPDDLLDINLKMAGRKSHARIRKVVKEIEEDLFEADKNCAIAHCISTESQVLAEQFRECLRNDEILGEGKEIGEVVVVQQDGRYIYYLITSRTNHEKATLKTMEKAFKCMRTHCVHYSVKRILMPRISYGLDTLGWKDVKACLNLVFSDTDVEILVFGSKQESNHDNASNLSELQNDDSPSFFDDDESRQGTDNRKMSSSFPSFCTSSVSKKKSENQVDEAIDVMRSLATGITKDSFDAYGQHIATRIRNLKNRRLVSTAFNRIDNTLYELEVLSFANSTISNQLPCTDCLPNDSPYSQDHTRDSGHFSISPKSSITTETYNTPPNMTPPNMVPSYTPYADNFEHQNIIISETRGNQSKSMLPLPNDISNSLEASQLETNPIDNYGLSKRSNRPKTSAGKKTKHPVSGNRKKK